MKETPMKSQFNEALQKTTNIFQLQLFNKDNKAKITPIYSGFQDLKFYCERILQRQCNNQKKSQYQSNKAFCPIVWVDIQRQGEQLQNEHSNSDKISQLFNQFQGILQNSSKQQKNCDKQRNFEDNCLKGKTINWSSCSDMKKRKAQIIESQNKNLFVTAKTLILKASELKNQEIDNMNIILIRVKIFTKNKKFLQLSNELLSMSVYLSDHMILNFKGKQDNNGQLNKFTQCIEQKIEKIKKSGQDKKNYRVDIILSEDIKYQNKSNHSFIKLHPFNNTQKGSIQVLQKFKKEIMQKLSLKSFNLINQNENRFENFIKKCEISARLLESPIKKCLFSSQELFSQVRINEKEKQFSKQFNLGQERLIKQKFERFYYDLRFSNKQQFPFHPSVVDFKLDQFLRSEFKDNIKSKKILQKISKQYKQKIRQTNQKQIKKLLQGSVKDYLKSIQLKNQVNQSIRYHPDKISSLMKEYFNIVQSSYMFVTEEIFNQIAYPQIYIHYYMKLYQEYQKVKKENDQNDKIAQQKTIFMKNDLEQFKIKNHNLQEESLKQKRQSQQLSEQLKVTILQKGRLNDELISWKQQANDVNKQLLRQQQKQKILEDVIEKLKQKIRDLQGKKIESLLGINKQQTLIKQSELLLMQKTINKQTLQSQSQISRFQYHLDNYKQQYNKLQRELKQKEAYLRERQGFYREKIKLLQGQIKLKSDHNLITEALSQKQVKQMKQSLRQQIQLQVNQKTQWRQSQYKTKISNYQLQLQQLQGIIKSNNNHISHLNQEIYALKRTIIQKQQTINEKQKTINKQKNNLRSIQNSTNQAIKSLKNNHQLIIQQNNIYIQQLTAQNILLTQTINSKTNKLKTLQNNIQNLTHTHQTSHNNNNLSTISVINPTKNKQNSFLRFQRDIQITALDQSLLINDITTKSIYSSNVTPIKQSNRIKAVTQIKQNIELQKLIQQRKTIEKRKEKCIKRQIIIQNLQKNNSLLNKSIIKQSSLLQEPFFSAQSLIFNKQQSQLQNSNQINKVLKESNNNKTHNKYDSNDRLSQQKLRKRLF